MHGLGYAAALVLAAVFAVAALAKLGDRAGTARTFRGLGLPVAAAVVVPIIELVLAVGLVLVPGWSATLALALLAAFTTFLARAVRNGVAVPCNCFGSARREPVSWVELLRNALLGVVAIAALTASRPTWPHAGALATIVVAFLTARAVLAWADGRRRVASEGPPLGSPAPAIDGVPWPALVVFLAPSCPTCAAARASLAGRGDAHLIELDDATRPIFSAYRVRGAPYYVEVDASGIVRWRGPELKTRHKAR